MSFCVTRIPKQDFRQACIYVRMHACVPACVRACRSSMPPTATNTANWGRIVFRIKSSRCPCSCRCGCLFLPRPSTALTTYAASTVGHNRHVAPPAPFGTSDSVSPTNRIAHDRSGIRNARNLHTLRLSLRRKWCGGHALLQRRTTSTIHKHVFRVRGFSDCCLLSAQRRTFPQPAFSQFQPNLY